MLGANFFAEELYQMRKKYRSKPLVDIKLNRPVWLDSEDPMSDIYYEKPTLLQQGEIVYAKIVQANSILFKRFPSLDCPAHIIYSTDSFFDKNPEILYDVASHIYSYKGQAPDIVPDEWKEVARVITDEYDRKGFSFTLNIDGHSYEFYMISTMIYRKLLPKGKLCGNIIPILTVPKCKQVLILPRKYWTKKFKKAWVVRAI